MSGASVDNEEKGVRAGVEEGGRVGNGVRDGATIGVREGVCVGARVHVGKLVALGVDKFIGVRVALTLLTVKVGTGVRRAIDEPVVDVRVTVIGGSPRFIPRAAKQINTPMTGAMLMANGSHQ